jgi:hypothetical protein
MHDGRVSEGDNRRPYFRNRQQNPTTSPRRFPYAIAQIALSGGFDCAGIVRRSNMSHSTVDATRRHVHPGEARINLLAHADEGLDEG